MAQSFPRSTFRGFDDHPESIAAARRAAAAAGVSERIVFEVASAKEYPGTGYDLVTFFDCLHDMGDPEGAARHVRKTLKPEGTWMVVEPYAHDAVEKAGEKRLRDVIERAGFERFRRAAETPFNIGPRSTPLTCGLAATGHGGRLGVQFSYDPSVMSAYRHPQEKPANPSDLETDALLDLRLRIERLRRRVALPFASAALLASALGVTAHVTGYWSVTGAFEDGRYYVSFFTILIATIVCSSPLALAGTAGYVAARARARAAWSASHTAHGVPAAWLAENVRRLS